MRKKLTALLITYNEEDLIQGVLENISFADEIIVVDSFSTDRTIEIVKRFKNVKLIRRAFNNFTDQREFAISKASNKWLFFLDADELTSENLKNEILNELENPGDIVAYGVKRNFYFKKKLIRFSGYQTHIVYRLFNKDYCYYDRRKKVHETLIFQGKTKILKNKLDHFSYKDEMSFKKKLTKYAQLRAEELFEKHKKPNLYHFYVKPLYRFVNQYFIRLGFLDGKEGYKISKLNAFEVKQRYLILKKMIKHKSENNII
ncbi:MAG: glycosyltransferase family 2 protein [Flavobacteriia bacterium]|nr:MAG: glycosyltransferase family 2 protein [Flavobacteriia bacterium]